MQPITNFFPTDDRNVASSQLKVRSSVESVRAIDSWERVSGVEPQWLCCFRIIGMRVAASNEPDRTSRIYSLLGTEFSEPLLRWR